MSHFRESDKVAPLTNLRGGEMAGLNRLPVLFLVTNLLSPGSWVFFQTRSVFGSTTDMLLLQVTDAMTPPQKQPAIADRK